MHEHLASYLINYPSFLFALSGAMSKEIYTLLLFLLINQFNFQLHPSSTAFSCKIWQIVL